jgi:hypothetical protein
MDYFWKENKRFTLAVGGAAIAALLYVSFVLSPIRSGAANAASQRTRERLEYDALVAQGVPAKDAVAAAGQDRDEAAKALSALVKDVAFKPAERFRKPEREAKGHYEDLRIKVGKELKERATKAKIDFQGDLGLSDDAPEERLAELLLRLAAVERLISAAIDAGVEKIEAVDGLADARDSGPAPRRGGFLEAHQVFLKARCSSEAAFRIVHGAQKKGNYLAVTKFAWAQEDPARDFGTASIGVAVLRVDEKAPLEPKAEERP